MQRVLKWMPGSLVALAVVMLGTGLTLAGCPPMMKTLQLSLTGLEDLGTDFVYEGWLIVNEAPVSTGRFTIDGTGAPSQDEFLVRASDADEASAFVLTIEPAVGDVSAPSMTHVIAGNFVDDEAALTIGHPAAFGDDFATAAGTYILNTPTTANNDDDYDQGIWWLEVGLLTFNPSLDLPFLPEGWAYEGWVADNDGPVSTGRFLTSSGEDSDGAGPDAGPDGFPNYPGQDFISPAFVLPGKTAVISVEPEPDNSPAPFSFKPLLDVNIDDPGIGVSQDMTNNVAATEPAGTATITE